MFGVVVFIEISTFTKQLPSHLDNDGYGALQAFLDAHPAAEREAWRKAVEAIDND